MPHDTDTPPTEKSNYWGNGAAFDASFPFIAHPATDITPASGTRTFTNPVPATVSLKFIQKLYPFNPT